MSYQSILVIPDQHIIAGQNLRRFEALGNLIDERLPDYVINLGDINEFSYLYGISGKRSWIFKQDTFDAVIDELKSANEAHEHLFKPYYSRIAKARKNRKKHAEIRTILCEGNHDARASNFFNYNRDQITSCLIDYFNKPKFYDEIFEYQVPVNIEGILFSHNFVNGTSTASTVDTIVKLAAGSAIGAHSHKGECSLTYNAVGRPTFGLQPGWFFDPDDARPDWVGAQGGGSWWNGVVILNGVDGTGYFDPEFIGVERLIKEYL